MIVSFYLLMIVAAGMVYSSNGTVLHSQTFTPRLYDNATLIVEVGLKGEVNWHTISSEELVLAINVTANNNGSQNDVDITFKETDNSTITLALQSNVDPCLVDSMSLRVIVDILAPENYTFAAVQLKATSGSIIIDEYLLNSAAQVQCSSGQFLHECPNCCNANGKCMFGHCHCTEGVYNGTVDCANKTDSKFRLFVNPTDPIIVAADTPEGDIVYVIGNKTSEGFTTSVDEFYIDNGDVSTTVVLADDGSIESAFSSDGLKSDLIWSENYTKLHISVVVDTANGSSEQLSITLDLTELTDNITLNDTDVDEDIQKRNAESISSQSTISQRGYQKRQVNTMTFVDVEVKVMSCNQPEPNARVYAEALLGYKSKSMTFDEEKHFFGAHGATPGCYFIRIPSKAPSDIAEKICDSVEKAIRKTCEYYSKIAEILKYIKQKPYKIVCRTIAFFFKRNPAGFLISRVVRVYKFCKKIFTGFETFCEYANKEIPLTDITYAQAFCKGVGELVDSGIDLFQTEKILFTPFALFPSGVTAAGNKQILSISPGSSGITTRVTIQDPTIKLEIISFTISPIDPLPGQSYNVMVVFKCYSSNTVVNMHIIGTDGYTDQTNCYGGPSCTLSVPGAAALVEDVVTVSISDPLSVVSLLRTVRVVF